MPRRDRQSQPRQSFCLRSELRPFHRGGPIQISPDNESIASAIGDEVSIINAKTAKVSHKIKGDSEPITAITWSKCSKKVFIASRSLALKEYSLQESTSVRKWKPHKMPVLKMSVDPTGQFLATASADRTVRVWDIGRGYATHNFVGHESMVVSVCFHETKGVLKVYSGGDNGEVCFWDLRAKKLERVVKDAHVSAVTSVQVSNCGKFLVTGGRDGVVRVIECDSGKIRSTTNCGEALEAAVVLPRRTKLFGGIDVSDNSVRFASVGSAGKVKLWKEGTAKAFLESSALTAGVESNAKSNTDFQAASGTFVECQIAEDGEMLVAVTGDARALFYETSTTRNKTKNSNISNNKLTIARELIGDCDEIVGLAFARSSLEQTVYENEIALIRDYNDPEEDAEKNKTKDDDDNDNDDDDKNKNGTKNDSSALNDANATRETLPPPELLCAATSSSPLLRVFQAHKNRKSGFICVAALSGHSEAILSVDCAPSKIKNSSSSDNNNTEISVSLAATGAKDHMVRLWNVDRKECIAFGKGHVSAVTSVAFAPKKNAPFIVSGGHDRALRIWDVSAALDAHAKANTTGDENVVIRMPAIAATVAHDKPINGVAVSPNHLLVASASADRTAKLWKMPDLLCAGVCRGHKRGVWAIAFSDVDKSVVTAGGDKIIRMWDCSNLTGGDLPCLKSFESHSGAVLAVRFISSGQQLASVGGDGKLLVWNCKTGLAVKEFDAHEDKAWALARGGDGAYIATGGADGSLKLWEDDTLLASKHREDKMQLGIEKDQQLADAEAIGNGGEALKLALKLDRPQAFLRVASRMTMERGEKGIQIVISVFKKLDTEETVRLLKYIRDWNTNSKTSGVANKILKCVLTANSLETMSKLPGIIDLCAGLKAYAIRHKNRAQRMYQSTFLIDTTLTRLGGLRDESEIFFGQESSSESSDDDEDDEDEDEKMKLKESTPPPTTKKQQVEPPSLAEATTTQKKKKRSLINWPEAKRNTTQKDEDTHKKDDDDDKEPAPTNSSKKNKRSRPVATTTEQEEEEEEPTATTTTTTTTAATKKGKGGRGRPPKAQKTETAKPSRAPKSASKKTTTKNAITKDQPPLLRRSLRSRSPTPI